MLDEFCLDTLFSTKTKTKTCLRDLGKDSPQAGDEQEKKGVNVIQKYKVNFLVTLDNPNMGKVHQDVIIKMNLSICSRVHGN